MADIQKLSPKEAAQQFSEALKNNNQDFIQAYITHLKTLSPEMRETYLNATNNNGQMPLHASVKNDNIAVTKELLTYYPNGDFPHTEVMSPWEYEERAPVPLYDFNGTVTPNGCFTKDGCYVFSTEYTERMADDGFGYPVEEYTPQLEVASWGRNPLYICCSEYEEGKVKNPEMVKLVLKNANEHDYHIAINQAIDRGDAETIKGLLKIGKEKGWAPSQDNIYSMDVFNPIITNVDLICGDTARQYEDVKAENDKTGRELTKTLTNENRKAVNNSLKKLDTAINQNNEEKALQIANRCIDLTMHEIMHDVAQKNNPKALEYLIKAGGDINVPDENGKTPLMIATENNQTKNIEFLANHPDCNVNAQDKDGNTALHWTTKNKCFKHVKILSNAGADSNMPNNEGITPKDMAEKHAQAGDRSILNILEQQKKETKEPSKSVSSILSEHAQLVSNEEATQTMPNRNKQYD